MGVYPVQQIKSQILQSEDVSAREVVVRRAFYIPPDDVFDLKLLLLPLVTVPMFSFCLECFLSCIMVNLEEFISFI